MDDNKNRNFLMNLFSTYKTVNSMLWTVAIICVLSWISRFSLMFYNMQQQYTEYSAVIEDVTTVINGTNITTTADISISGFGKITMNADGTDINTSMKGNRITVYCKDNCFLLKKPQTAPKEVIKICGIISVVSLIAWIVCFILDKILLIPFFKYGGIEAWSYNNLYIRKE